MGLLQLLSACRRGSTPADVQAAETTYSELADYPDLQTPVAAFPLRNALQNPLRHPLLEELRTKILRILEELMTGPWRTYMESDDDDWKVATLYESDQDIAARMLILFALDSFFGPFLKTKVPLTGNADARIFYERAGNAAPFYFYTEKPNLDLPQVRAALASYGTLDSTFDELASRVLTDSDTIRENIGARFRLCCAAILIAIYAEGRV